MGYTVSIANLDSRQKEALQKEQGLDFACIKKISGKQRAVWIIWQKKQGIKKNGAAYLKEKIGGFLI